MAAIFPKFTIITVNLNNRDGLEKTLESVKRQQSTDYELIVIDGKSTDGSVEVIKNYKSTISRWVSEKDTGMYNAMNKGIALAQGEYLLFLNSGDLLSSDYVLLDLLHYPMEKQVYIGNLIVQDNEEKKTWVVDFKEHIFNAAFFKEYALPHQATLFHRSVFEHYGTYNESYRLLGDHEYFMRLMSHGVEIAHIPVAISVYDNTGRSSDLKNQTIVKQEKSRMFDEVLGSPPVHFFSIVLNGMPYVQYHIEVMKKLPFRWHWHIIEGVAALTKDTAWSLTTGATIPEQFHKDGRSIDGTSEYLDRLQKQFPENITVYRKPLGEFWDGKLEMVNAPMNAITEETILWEIDIDELWTYEQFVCMREMFLLYPEKLAAHFLCYVFVGKDLVLSNLSKYGNNPNQEWYRVWRVFPGTTWHAHEPPKLNRSGSDGPEQNEAEHTFSHIETASAGLVFQHYAYAIPKQPSFKEKYYGYKDALAQWHKLQAVKDFPVYFRDYCEWVTDGTTVRKASDFGIVPIMRAGKNEKYSFDYSVRLLPQPSENMLFQLVQSALGKSDKAAVFFPTRPEPAKTRSRDEYTYVETRVFERIHRFKERIFPTNSGLERLVKRVIKTILRRK